jgi:hypothetical protein
MAHAKASRPSSSADTLDADNSAQQTNDTQDAALLEALEVVAAKATMAECPGNTRGLVPANSLTSLV